MLHKEKEVQGSDIRAGNNSSINIQKPVNKKAIQTNEWLSC